MRYFILPFFCLFLLSCESTPDIPDNSNNDVLLMDELKKENLQLNRTIVDRDSLVNNYAKSINHIRTNLAKISSQEKLIVKQQNNSENLSIDNTDLVDEIKNIGQLMIDNKRLINQLNNQLAQSDGELFELELLINSLAEDVEKKNMEIFYLQEELENMDASFKELFHQYNQRLDEIEQFNNVLNSAWFTFGSKNELLDNGVITKEGGFIGIGKNTVLKDDFNKAYFNEIKISEFKELTLGVKTVKFITPHPKSSYELIGDQQVDKLVVLDADLFWSNSKYLVIAVKQ